VDFEFENKWIIKSIRTGTLTALSPTDEDKFAAALDEYSSKIWRRPRTRKKFRYDLAILYNPGEDLPPSDRQALANFIKAGKEHDVNVELVQKKDLARLAEYDALFIRETTALNHHTYHFAKKAETEGLVVIDDSMSILRCTNKIYMHNLLHANKIHAPRTVILSRDNPRQLDVAIEEIGLPLIIKIPDGSFSKGIYKVETREDLTRVSEELFKRTALLLAQEFFYTDFDWRIGVLNDRPIFACKYYMTKGHWQIYNHEKADHVLSGPSETLPLSKVPKHVLNTAVKVSHHVGNSLYGVDLKEKDGKAFVIEINDNPNIDTDIEDAIAGMDLYHNIIHEFVRRIEENR
jgi:glutathione synthase/RimK-type ligase-like ATP-grasp enzyme